MTLNCYGVPLGKVLSMLSVSNESITLCLVVNLRQFEKLVKNKKDFFSRFLNNNAKN